MSVPETLTPREAKVLKLRSGRRRPGAHPEEVGKYFKVTGEDPTDRSKGPAQAQAPRRSRKLKDSLD